MDDAGVRIGRVDIGAKGNPCVFPCHCAWEAHLLIQKRLHEGATNSHVQARGAHGEASAPQSGG
eukprot:3929599-Pyramimonas_sp.AAC.2